MNKKRRSLLLAVTVSLCTSGFAIAQEKWPSRPVTIISPYGAGGPNDFSARLLAEHLKNSVGQTFIVENKAGAGTRLGTRYVAHAAPDGYTILYGAAPYATMEALYGKLDFNPRKDMQPVAMTAKAPLFLIVNAQLPVKNAQELIAYGKSRPEGLTFGSPGTGSMPHLAQELLFLDAGLKGISVHYRGDAQAYTDLLAGRVDATLTSISAALPHIKSGKLRVLGVASATRSEIYPDALPLREQGFPNVVASGWYGFMVPREVPKAVVERLDSEMNRAMRDSDMKKRLIAQGMEPHYLGVADFGKFINSEMDKWSDVITKAGIKGE